mmetsp:Transcript_24162/g.67812  ORF Transcript_24162/g.67812 Transcript_24162/m.67812 type:complete len:206 (-) Transcript_24162:429-1046(-)
MLISPMSTGSALRAIVKHVFAPPHLSLVICSVHSKRAVGNQVPFSGGSFSNEPKPCSCKPRGHCRPCNNSSIVFGSKGGSVSGSGSGVQSLPDGSYQSGTTHGSSPSKSFPFRTRFVPNPSSTRSFSSACSGGVAPKAAHICFLADSRSFGFSVFVTRGGGGGSQTSTFGAILADSLRALWSCGSSASSRCFLSQAVSHAEPGGG